MRFSARWLRLVPLVVLVAVLLGGQATSAGVSAQGRDDDRREGRDDRNTVVIHDNNAPSPQVSFDPAQGRWGVSPEHLRVTRGEHIVFRNPAGNFHPHTVTSLVRVDGPFPDPVQFQGGTLFDSSPTPATVIQPGQSYNPPEIPALPPGNYAYICKLHPWMNAEFTVR